MTLRLRRVRPLAIGVLSAILVSALPAWGSHLETMHVGSDEDHAPSCGPVGPADPRGPRSSRPTASSPVPGGRPPIDGWTVALPLDAERTLFWRRARRGATLPAYNLRRMARDLGLEIDPDELAGRGRSLRARDAFWDAANRAVLDSIDQRDLIRLARIYGAQAAILLSEGRHFQRLVAEAVRSDLGGIDTSSVRVIAKDCDVCARDDGRRLSTEEARGGALLPHSGCQRGHCSCLYSHAMPAAREVRPLGPAGEAAYRHVERELRASLLEPMRSIATSGRLSPQLRRTAARLLLERQERHLVDETITAVTEEERLAQRRAVLDAISILDALVGLAGDEQLSHEERRLQARSLMGADAA